MKRVLISIFVIAFVFSAIMASAEEGESGVSAKKGCGAKAKAGCCAKKATTASVEKLSEEVTKETAETGHVCPDVSSKAALETFHENMHPMHVALNDNNFDALREGLPNLVEATKAVGEYNCVSYDKCSDACRKTFDSRKAELLDSVALLKEACKGKDNEKVTASFNQMHEAYITFANTCSH